MLAIHPETSRAYCLVVMHRPGPRRPGNRNSPGLLPRGFQVVIDCLTALLRQFEFDGLPSLLLRNYRTIDCVPARSDILNLHGYDIAATQLAVDGEVEHSQVTGLSLNQQPGPDRPNVLWSQWRFRPNQLALVPGRAAGAAEKTLSDIVVLLC